MKRSYLYKTFVRAARNAGMCTGRSCTLREVLIFVQPVQARCKVVPPFREDARHDATGALPESQMFHLMLVKYLRELRDIIYSK